MEEETAAWFKMDPDPFDDRHPGSRFFQSLQFAIYIFVMFFLGRADPKCALGHLLKAVFKNEAFMNKVNEWHQFRVS